MPENNTYPEIWKGSGAFTTLLSLEMCTVVLCVLYCVCVVVLCLLLYCVCCCTVCVVVLCVVVLCVLYCMCCTVCVLLSHILWLSDCWPEVSIRKVLRSAISTQVSLGFLVSKSEF